MVKCGCNPSWAPYWNRKIKSIKVGNLIDEEIYHAINGSMSWHKTSQGHYWSIFRPGTTITKEFIEHICFNFGVEVVYPKLDSYK